MCDLCVMTCLNNLQRPECDVLVKVYSAGNAPWDNDEFMLPVVADDLLLQFGKLFIIIYTCMRHWHEMHYTQIISIYHTLTD